MSLRRDTIGAATASKRSYDPDPKPTPRPRAPRRRITQRSSRKQQRDAEYALNRPVALRRDRYRCQGPRWGLTGACDGEIEVHHRIFRQWTRPYVIHDAAWLLTLCDAHHDWVHANVQKAETILGPDGFGLAVRPRNIPGLEVGP